MRAGSDARGVRREGQGGRAQEDQGRAGVVPQQVLKVHSSSIK